VKTSYFITLALLLSGCASDQNFEELDGAPLQGEPEAPRDVALSGALRVVPAEPGQAYVRCGTAAGEALWRLSFSPDGRRLAAHTNAGTVRLIATDTWKEIAELAFPIGAVDAVAFSHEGVLAMLSVEAGQVALVRSEDGTITQRFAVRPTTIDRPPYGKSLLFAPDGSRLITSLRTVIDLRTGAVTDWTGVPAGPTIYARQSIGVSYMKLIGTEENERLLAYTRQQLSNMISGQTLLLAQLGTTNQLKLVDDSYATSFAVSRDGRWIAYGPYGIKLHELDKKQAFASDSFGSMTPLDFSPDGSELYAMTQNELEVLAVPTLKPLRRVRLLFDARYRGLSPHGLLAASSEAGTVVVNPQTGTLHRSLPLHFESIAWSNDGKLGAGSGPGALLYVWREPDGQPIAVRPHAPDAKQLPKLSGSTTSLDGTLAFRSPDRFHTASTDWYGRIVEDTAAKRTVRAFSYARSVAGELSPDGARLVTLEYEAYPPYHATWCR
jgi:WD40 repeat protein